MRKKKDDKHMVKEQEICQPQTEANPTPDIPLNQLDLGDDDMVLDDSQGEAGEDTPADELPTSTQAADGQQEEDKQPADKTMEKPKGFKRFWNIFGAYIILLPIVFCISSAYIVNIPRTYKAETKLAPESSSSSGISSLSNIASSFGFDIGMGQSEDAVYPELYPDLFQSSNFIINLLKVKVVSQNRKISTTYYDYLCKYQKTTPWDPYIKKLKEKYTKKEPEAAGARPDTLDPYHLTRKQEMLIKGVAGSIVCSVDKQTSVITIAVTDQDPYIAACMADSARALLQEFITNYRTNKARTDLDYYEKLVGQAKKDYQKSVKLYAEYADSHQGDLLQTYQSKRDELENDMQLKYNTMTALLQQLENAKAKVQERTPAFTTIWNTTVPVKPSGPKRMIFVAACLLFTMFSIFCWHKRHYLLGDLI